MSHSRLIQSIYKIINIAVVIFIGVSFFFSMQSRTLSFDGLTDKFVGVLFFFLVLIFLSLLIFKNSNIVVLLDWLKQNQKRIFWLIFTFVVVYQLVLLYFIDSFPAFDAGGLIAGITKPKANNMSNYLSYNKNNRFIYFFNFYLSKLIGTNIKHFQLFNIVVITLSILMIKVVAEHFFDSKSLGYITSILFMIYAALQPLFLVPYTDTYCILPMLISIYLLIYSYQQIQILKKICSALLAGVFFSLCYLIRPSAILFVIATALILLINIRNETIRKFLLLIIPSFLISSVLILGLFNIFVAQQTIVKIDHSKEIPLTHFILLGSFGDKDKNDSLHGTWNSEDVNLTQGQQNKTDMVHADLTALKLRTKQRGLFGTLKFYFQKYSNTTDTGVIGFHRDGLWTGFKYAKPGTFKNKVQQIYGQDGQLRANFNFIIQVMWLPTLIFVIIGLLSEVTEKSALIALTLLGGLLFLVIFESGGTKYLFQYIPFVCLLSAIGIKNSVHKYLAHFEKVEHAA